ncbi:MAG TPA: hypothetical protein VKU44_02670 [Terriglobia bacterium]|nr:hypothetical protein [Terriglobia bacterium]
MQQLIERSTTPAMAAANRLNAGHSTGPRTERGKSRSRCNALKHWGRAEAMRDLMPSLGEAAADYQATLDGLCRSLAPEDDFEVILVQDMADLHWRLRRSIRGETAHQAHRRRRELQRLDERNAGQENGGSLTGPEQAMLSLVGFTGLPDSPAKFYRVIEFLKMFGALVGYGKMGGEGVSFLQTIYGPMPSPAGKSLISAFEHYLEADAAPPGDHDAQKAERSARIVASRAAFLQALEEEVAWFEKRAAANRQARAELAGPSVECELLYAKPDPDRLALAQERLERRFEKKFEMLVRYRRMRRAGDLFGSPGLPPDDTPSENVGAPLAAPSSPTAPDGTPLDVIPAEAGIHPTPLDVNPIPAEAGTPAAGTNGGSEKPKVNERSRQGIENTGSAISGDGESRQHTENTPVTETSRQATENKRHKPRGNPPGERRER